MPEGTVVGDEGRAVGRRLALIYGAVFFIVGIQTAYLPAWLLTRGLTETGIALVLSVPMLVRVVTTPVITLAADRFQNQRQILVLLAWGVLVAACVLTFTSGLAAILIVMTVYATFWTTVMPMTEALAIRGVRSLSLDYGRMRLWGSLTFIAASLSGGWVLGQYGAGPVVPMMIVAAVVLVAATHLTQRGYFPPQTSATPAPRVGVADITALLSDRRLLLLFIASGTAQATHAVYYAFGTIHWQAVGLPPTAIGALWTIGVVAEIALFMVSRRAVALLSAGGLMVFGAAAGLLRWPLTALDPPLAMLCFIQILHGATFGAVHLGAVHLIGDIAGEHRASTAQGLHATFATGLFMAAALAASGSLYRSFGAGAYATMAVLSVVATLAAIALVVTLRAYPQSAGDGGDNNAPS